MFKAFAICDSGGEIYRPPSVPALYECTSYYCMWQTGPLPDVEAFWQLLTWEKLSVSPTSWYKTLQSHCLELTKCGFLLDVLIFWDGRTVNSSWKLIWHSLRTGDHPPATRQSSQWPPQSVKEAFICIIIHMDSDVRLTCFARDPSRSTNRVSSKSRVKTIAKPFPGMWEPDSDHILQLQSQD